MNLLAVANIEFRAEAAMNLFLTSKLECSLHRVPSNFTLIVNQQNVFYETRTKNPVSVLNHSKDFKANYSHN